MPTAFVLSGGASLGAVQVGMLRALLERDVQPDMIVGSSVGAVNGAWMAAHCDSRGVDVLADIWASIRRRDVFPVHPLAGLLGFLGRHDHLVPPSGLRRLLERHLSFTQLEDAEIPLHVVATELTTGREVLLSKGSAVDAVMASAAIPGVFPPVRIGKHDLVDGGVVDNAPIAHAVSLGADRVYVLPTGYPCDLSRAPRSALGVVLQALSLLIERQLVHDIDRYENSVELHVIPPLCPLAVSPTDFGQSRYLMDRAYAESRLWLAQPRPRHGQSRLLGFHTHGAAPRSDAKAEP